MSRLSSENAERRVAARTATVNMHAFALAGRPEIGVNPEALLRTTTWQARAAQLDPNAPDFAAQLEAALKAEAEASPWLKTAPAAPPRSGGEPPTPGAPTNKTPMPLHAAVSRALGG